MFLKVTRNASGEYYSVCESVYDKAKGVRRQRTILYLGDAQKFREFVAMLEGTFKRARQDKIERVRKALL